MAGCDTKTLPPGNYDWSANRITAWAMIFGAAGAVWAIANLLGGPIGWVGALAVAIMFVAGAGLGFWVGNGVEWLSRLKEQDPKTITVAGMVVCAGKNTGIPPWHDNDWTFNMSKNIVANVSAMALTLEGPNVPGLDINEVLTRAAPDSGQTQSYQAIDPNNNDIPIFHCEIGSNIGDYSAVGGAVGSIAGTIAGLAAGIAICAALGIFTFGIGAALCLLIIAILAAAGAWLGGMAGNLIGAGLGWIADELSDFDKKGKAISQDCMTFTGRWVTDKSHQHNEIHDIESAQIIDCREAVGTGSAGLGLAGAVGIGRHPTGYDP
jgi:hypothetical protein